MAIISGAAWGAVTELLVIRRLFYQPRLLLFVATLGVSQVVLLVMFRLPEITQAVSFPSATDRLWHVWGIDVRGDQLVVLITVPVLAALLSLLIARTRFGQAVRACADNSNAASLAGISVKAVSTQVWIIAGALSAISAVLIAPIQGTNAGAVEASLGPSLLLRALAAAMIGQLVSFPLTMLGGVLIGVMEVLIKVNTDTGGLDTLAIFLLLLGLVLFHAPRSGTDEGGLAFTGRLRSAAQELAELPWSRWANRGAVTVMFLAAAIVPFLVETQTEKDRYARVLIVLIVALSATVLTGWAGQLSLGQFAFVGVGAYATAWFARDLEYPVALLLGTATGVAIALVVGIPALRIRGLYLAIVTLGFQLTCSTWLFGLEWLNNGTGGATARLEHSTLWRWDLQRDKQAFYFVCLTAVLVVTFVVTRVRRTGIGRSLIAVRDNEAAAAAFTVAPVKAKLTAFALSGGIASFAGGLYAASPQTISGSLFGPEQSLQIVSISIVGGVVSVVGAALGTFVIEGLPTIFDSSSEVKLFASGVGMLVLLMYFPSGLIAIVHSIRDLLYHWISAHTGLGGPAARPRPVLATLSTRAGERSGDGTAAPLRTIDVTVRFGGLVAVDHVDIDVRPGEVVGLIGTNGAGKTTLMNTISGGVPCRGHIELFGRRVDDTPTHRRARLGVGRAFQNAKLFGALTVRETLMVALEARARSLLVPSMLALPPSPRQERRKRREADEIIGYLGLGRYADQAVVELSTGTRRIVELASLIALDAKLLLLDEPTAGVAQKETEAFGPLILEIQRDLGASILIVEHDMPLVMSISDRIFCLEAGRVIAEGTPDEVAHDPRVIASYLGTDERAIRRSDVAPVAGKVPGS